jgi:hypothetical protein
MACLWKTSRLVSLSQSFIEPGIVGNRVDFRSFKTQVREGLLWPAGITTQIYRLQLQRREEALHRPSPQQSPRWFMLRRYSAWLATAGIPFFCTGCARRIHLRIMLRWIPRSRDTSASDIHAQPAQYDSMATVQKQHVRAAVFLKSQISVSNPHQLPGVEIGYFLQGGGRKPLQ